MPLKVATSGGSMYFSAIENALYYAADNGADVISISLGAYVSSDPGTDAAINYAYNAGCVILAATSNDNDNVISYPEAHVVITLQKQLAGRMRQSADHLCHSSLSQIWCIGQG